MALKPLWNRVFDRYPWINILLFYGVRKLPFYGLRKLLKKYMNSVVERMGFEPMKP